MQKRKIVCLNRFKSEAAKVQGITKVGEVIAVAPERADTLIRMGLCAAVSSQTGGIMRHTPAEAEETFLVHHKGGGNFDVLSAEGLKINEENLRGRQEAEAFADASA